MTFALREPTDLLALIPYLLGFHPDDSLAMLVLRGKAVVYCSRGDLLPPDVEPSELRDEIDYLAEAAVHHRSDAALLVGYGPADRVDPMLVGLREELLRRKVPVPEALRADGGRYWSLVCASDGCCPPDGTPYDTATSPVTTAAIAAGRVALPDRHALVRQVAPIGGLTRISMAQATNRATDRLVELVAEPPDERSARAALLEAGEQAITEAVARQRAGKPLDDDEAAWLSVLLYAVPVRDHAWYSIDDDPDTLAAHRALWLDLTRRAEPDLVAAPGSLLAFTAWRLGDGALAAVALDRVLRTEPGYRMAELIAHALAGHAPPSMLDGWGPTTRGRGKRPRKRSSSRRARNQPA